MLTGLDPKLASRPQDRDEFASAISQRKGQNIYPSLIHVSMSVCALKVESDRRQKIFCLSAIAVFQRYAKMLAEIQ